MAPVRGAKQGASVSYVAKRPQPLVGKTVVITFFLFLTQPDASQGVAWVVGRDPQPVIVVHGFPVGVATAMRDPGAIAGLQHRLQSRNQAAGGNHDLQVPASASVKIWLPVGYSDQTAVSQFAAHVHGEPLRCPYGFRRFAQLGLSFGGRARMLQALGERRHFTRQGLKDVPIRNGRRACRSPSCSQGPHPLGGSRNRPTQAPTDNQQRDQRNDDHLSQHAEERLAPNPPRLCPDVARIMHNRQTTLDLVLTVVQRQSVNVDGSGTGARELPLPAVVLHGLDYGGRLAFHRSVSAPE